MKQTDSTNNNRSAAAIGESLLLSLYYVLACAYIPLCTFLNIDMTAVSVLSLAICVLGVVVMAKAAGTFKAILGYSVILGIFIFLGGSLLPVGLFSAFATAVCIFTHLQLKYKSPLLWALPIIPLIVTFAVTGSLIASVISISALPAAIALISAVKAEVGKVSAICRISFGICLSVAATFLGIVYVLYGSISFGLCRQAIDTARAFSIELVNATAVQLEGMLGTSATILDSDTVAYAVGVVFNVLPAVIIIIANIISYIVHSMFLSIRFATLEDKKKAMPMLSFEMSLVSAVVFLLSLAVSFVFSTSSSEIYGTVALNIMLILIPGLILTAIAGIRMLTMRKGPSCFGTLVYIGAIFLIATLSPIVIIAASTFGAILIIITNITRSKAQKDKT